jgi:vacuolar-type H+-ATPase subunit E/Vma4
MSKTNGKNNRATGIEDGKTSLIRGIEDDAKKEAADILAAAEKARDERVAAGNKQVASILDEAKAKALEQVHAIAKNNVSLISVDTKRQMLRLHERIISLVMEEVQKKMESLVSSPGYPAMLKDWIIEAVMGIAGTDVSINASAAEKQLITQKLLRETEAEVGKLAGRKVSITLSDSPPLGSQGIMVTSLDGRTAFNNQVLTRLLRSQTEIRKLIYRELFGE